MRRLVPLKKMFGTKCCKTFSSGQGNVYFGFLGHVLINNIDCSRSEKERGGRERVCVCMRECECVYERECVCVRERERRDVCVCVCLFKCE